jgi:hypothetical protein
MLRRLIHKINLLWNELVSFAVPNEFALYVYIAILCLVIFYFLKRFARKQYLYWQFSQIELLPKIGKLRFKEYKNRFEFYSYNANCSDIAWWNSNLGKLSAIIDQALLSSETAERKFRQNKIILWKDRFPEKYTKIFKKLSPLSFNGGTTQKKKRLLVSLLDKSGVALFMQANQGKTTLLLSVLIDLIYSFSKSLLSPILIISAPKDEGIDFQKLKTIYGRVEIYDTSTNEDLRQFIERFKELMEIMKDARNQAAKKMDSFNHDCKIPEGYLYIPFFYSFG